MEKNNNNNNNNKYLKGLRAKSLIPREGGWGGGLKVLGRFLIQVTFHRSPLQVTVLPINKQAKQCPQALNQAKTSPSMSEDTVTGHCVTDK